MAFGIDDAIAAGLTVLNKFIPDPAAKIAAEAELRSSLQAWDASQNQVNAAEATNSNLFVAGWRPFVGWVCGSALAYSFIVQPVLAFAISATTGKLPLLPTLDSGSLMTILLGMLGLAGARTYEKLKGVST